MIFKTWGKSIKISKGNNKVYNENKCSILGEIEIEMLYMQEKKGENKLYRQSESCYFIPKKENKISTKILIGYTKSTLLTY